MKKILCILLTLVLICSFAACTVEYDTDATSGTTDKPADTTAEATAEATAAVTTEESAIVTTEAAPEGYAITFETDEFVSVKVYETQDLTGEGAAPEGAVSRNADTGIPTKTDGQVNFVLSFTEGYELDEITITGEYNKLKGSGDTGTENGYRITKVTGDLTVSVTSRAIDTAEDDSANGYAVTFSTDEFVTVTVFRTQDLTSNGTETNTAASRDGATGAATKSDGQVNFVLSFAEGYELGTITVTGSYKNLKGPDEIGTANAYRITKVAGDLTVTVTAKVKE